MSSPTIPFGPGTEPLGLAAASFEFISLEGPQISIENETESQKADGTFLRVAGTREKHSYTANYQILDADAVLPTRGLYDASTAGIARQVWISSVNRSEPQAADQTVAVAFWFSADVTNQEGLRADLVDEESSS